MRTPDFLGADTRQQGKPSETCVVSVCIYIYIYTHIYTYTYIYIYIHIYIYVYMYVTDYLWTCFWPRRPWNLSRRPNCDAEKLAALGLYIGMCVYIYIYIYIYIHIYIYIYIHTYIYIYIYIHTYTEWASAGGFTRDTRVISVRFS